MCKEFTVKYSWDKHLWREDAEWGEGNVKLQ
jgi:hypothetical protein